MHGQFIQYNGGPLICGYNQVQVRRLHAQLNHGLWIISTFSCIPRVDEVIEGILPDVSQDGQRSQQASSID
ncbi:hypothetical protein EUGRSUZ_K00559 [Eucalyptus grandis]|uniref:Uncharacterized protein n=2 Tax=Eucalyptus grandis TaxID=71139 RepID=A0ACC3ISS7_EUCGR|nr:hypothetical protein EUGRSUZ_K00559 [Eucalyptus grandis]